MLALLVDGNSLLHRVVRTKLAELSYKGVPTGILLGFMKSITSVLKKYAKNDRASVIITWDSGYADRRYIFEGYKRKAPSPSREKISDMIERGSGVVTSLFSLLGIPCFLVEGYESDDVLYYLSKVVEGEKIILTEDHDLLQAISESTTVFTPKSNRRHTIRSIRNKLGVVGEEEAAYVLFKALVGDPSDQIPGVRGVGESSAVQLVKEAFGTNEKPIKVQLLRKVCDWEGTIVRNLQLISISRVVNLNLEKFSESLSIQYDTFSGLVNKKQFIEALMELNFEKSLEIASYLTRLELPQINFQKPIYDTYPVVTAKFSSLLSEAERRYYE